MNMKQTWLLETITTQIEMLERREGREVVAVRIAVAPPDADRIGHELRAARPGLEVEVERQPGRPRVLWASFALESS